MHSLHLQTFSGTSRTIAGLIILLVTGFVSAQSEIIDSTARGFTVRSVASIAAPPHIVYLNLAEHVDKWWSSSHTYSGNSRNLSLDARAGGCFCEKLKNGGSVRHAVVVFADSGRTLRLSGALGPLQSMAVSAVLTWSLARTETGTRVELTYVVGGYSPGGLSSLAAGVDKVLLEQLMRLKKLIEQGKPD